MVLTGKNTEMDNKSNTLSIHSGGCTHLDTPPHLRTSISFLRPWKSMRRRANGQADALKQRLVSLNMSNASWKPLIEKQGRGGQRRISGESLPRSPAVD